MNKKSQAYPRLPLRQTGLRALLAAFLLGATTACTALPGPADPSGAAWHFAAIGDTPYTTRDRQVLPGMLEKLAAETPAFVIHVGDLKSGSERCDDALLDSRVLGFMRPGLPPFAFTPGDNDWTDCHRDSNGGFDPIERLGFLRRSYFAADARIPLSLPGAVRQSDAMPAYGDYSENLAWRRGPVMFITLNVPGSNNNRGHKKAASAEFLQRGAANRAWLADLYAHAQADDSIRALVIFMQADPGFDAFRAGRPSKGYAPLLEQLQFIAGHFNGEVLLIHGDTHAPRLDQPMPIPGEPGQTYPRFTRALVPGSPFLGWVDVFIRPEGAPTLNPGLKIHQTDTLTP